MTDLSSPAIGRKLCRLMRDDRPALIAILRATPRDQWRLLADAYVQAVGVTEATSRQAKRLPSMPQTYWSERKLWSARTWGRCLSLQRFRSSQLSSNSKSSLRNLTT